MHSNSKKSNRKRHTGAMHAKPFTAGGAAAKGKYIGKEPSKCGARANCVKGSGGNPYEGKR